MAAISDYEAEMREYGAAAVRYSLEQKDQALATGAAAKAGVRAFFRLCQLVPRYAGAPSQRPGSAPPNHTSGNTAPSEDSSSRIGALGRAGKGNSPTAMPVHPGPTAVRDRLGVNAEHLYTLVVRTGRLRRWFP